MAADGSIVIATKMDTKDAQRELNRLRQKLIKLGDDLSDKKARRSYLEKEFEDAYKKLDELQKNAPKNKYGGLANPEDKQLFDELIQKTKELHAEWEKVNKEIGMDEAVYNTTLDRWATLEKSVTGVAAKAKEAWTRASEAIKKNFSHAIKNFFSGVGEKITDGVKKLFGFNNAAKATGAAMTRLGNMIKNAFVFNVISQGLNYVREQVGEYLQTNTQLMSALSQLKGALASAFAPIFSAIVPALTTLISWVTSAITAVAQFIAALFGKTIKFTQATTAATKAGTSASGKNADAMENQADAMEDVGEAADDATKSLAAFDEINTLATDNAKEAAKAPSAGGSSGGGGGGGGGGGAWTPTGVEFETIDNPFEDWGQAFSDFLDKILNEGIPRLREGFEKFAEWFNGLTKRLYDMFTFPGVEEKVILIGQRLAEAFNHLVDLIDWEMLGRALGAGLNLALQFVVAFVYSFDWIALGGALSQMLNGLVYEVDWYAFGQFLWAQFKIALETLAGFLSNLDMPALAQAASDIIIGFFDSMTETIQSIDWQHLGEQVRDFLANLDWAGIAQSVFTAIGAGFGALGEFLNGLFGDAVIGIIEYMNGKIQEFIDMGGDVSAGFLYGILCGLVDIATWIYDNVFTPFIEGFKSVFGIASPSTVMQEMGGYLVEGVKVGMELGWPSVTAFVDTMKQFFSDSWTSIQQTAQEMFQAVSDTIASIWESISNKVSETVNGMKEKLSTAWGDIKSTAQTGLNGLKSAFQSAWDGIVGIVSSAVSKIKGFISDVISAAGNIASSIGNTISGAFSGSRISTYTPFGVPAFELPSIKPFEIPALAAGAVIPANRSFLAVLGDQPTGTNIEAPLETIEQALDNVFSRHQGDNDIKIVFTGDLAQLGRILHPVIENRKKVVGNSLIDERIV